MRGRTRGTAAVAVAACMVLAACGAEVDEGPETPAELAEETDPAEETRDMAGALELRLDSERSDPGEFRMNEDDEGLHILTGPAGIAWRPGDEVSSGDFRVSATFQQFAAPVGYREAFGIFVGGRDLQGPDVEYTYLLVRGTGDFLVKRRVGETTETIVDWTAHDAVDAVDSEGEEPVNELAIESEDGRTRYLINGEEVYSQPTPEARPYGIAGIRANHRLDVRVRDWEVETD